MLMKIDDVGFMQASITAAMSLEELEFAKPENRIKFFYALTQNSKRIKAAFEAMGEAQKNDKRYKEFSDKRIELCKKYADKDKDGKPILNEKTGGFKIAEQRNEFDKALIPLREEYKDNLYDKVEIVPFKFKHDILPIGKNFAGYMQEGLDHCIVYPPLTSDEESLQK
jgi:hypothetical protein